VETHAEAVAWLSGLSDAGDSIALSTLR